MSGRPTDYQPPSALRAASRSTDYFKPPSFQELQEKYCAKTQAGQDHIKLYTDLSFSPNEKSLLLPSYKKTRLGLAISKANIQWMRASEICKTLGRKVKPKLVVNGVTLLDVNQGFFDNCWYIAAVAHLAMRPELFDKVVPNDQDFGDRYAGVFHFNIWRYGEWHEVIIDDYLPCYKDNHGNWQLYFLSNKREPNEYWAALLEKAYAKLHGCYEALEKGYPEDAMVDLTGGVGYRIEMGDSKPGEIFQHIKKCAAKNSLFSCSVSLSTYRSYTSWEHSVSGHAYTITKVVEVKDRTGKLHQLIRLRNPLGRMEWDGQWSDYDTQTWQILDTHTRQKILTRNIEDGEYWMSFQDFLGRFYQIQVCFIPPSDKNTPTSGSSTADKKWNLFQYPVSSWITSLSAGGPYSENNSNFWFNPQFILDVPDKTPQDRHDSVETTVIVSLMKINNRKLERKGQFVGINFDVFQVLDKGSDSLRNGTDRQPKRVHIGSERHENYQREVSAWLSMTPGRYYIIPSTAHYTQQASFLLRMFIEAVPESVPMASLSEDRTQPITALDNENDDFVPDLFKKCANGDDVLDAYELKPLLDEAFSKGLKDSNDFDLQTCRSLLVAFDSDQTGLIDLEEFLQMWDKLKNWRRAFKQFDTNNSNSMDVKELHRLFNQSGYQISNRVTEAIVRKYSGKGKHLTFNDYLISMNVLVNHMKIYPNLMKDTPNPPSLEEYLYSVLYF